jgi:hypothetical protein
MAIEGQDVGDILLGGITNLIGKLCWWFTRRLQVTGETSPLLVFIGQH